MALIKLHQTAPVFGVFGINENKITKILKK